MKALILSGGTGTRLRPLTYSSAKQLLPLANKPILFYIIEKIVKAGIRDIGIIVGNTHEEVKKTVGDGRLWGAKVTYIYQPQALGLAHAVKTAAEFLGNSDFIMILGDNIFSMDLDIVIENFYTNKANTTVLLHRVNNPSQYGVAVVKDGRITDVVEKPKDYISDLIITGVYVFDKTIFSAIEETPPSARGEYEITDAIRKQLEMGGKVTYELIRGWWKDTGRLEDMLEANRLILDELENKNTTTDYPGSTISGKVVLGENVEIKDSIILGPAHIDQDSVIINSFIGPYTTLGKRVTVEECELDNCIVLSGTKLIGINKRISNSLIGKNVSIKGGLNKKPLVSSFFVGDNSEINL
mgnify:FL=1